jgi:oxygen-dependent protoporphyrinogen oxidase
MRQLIVIGGGLAGLTAALHAARATRGRAQVVVLEAADRLGGQIWTEASAGFVIERGGEGFVFRSAAVPELASAVGLGDALIGQSTLISYGFGVKGLLALAPGEAATYLGFQVPAEDLGKGIRSFRAGMGSLIEALERALRDEGVRIELGVPALGVERIDNGVRVYAREPLARDADAVVVATSASAAALVMSPLLGVPHPIALSALSQAATLSSLTVELAFARGDIDHALDGTGFVVATALQQQGLRACTFTTSKFEARAPEGAVSVRVFFRPEPGELDGLDDAAWRARAIEGLSRILTLRAAPRAAWVSRWPNALPVHGPAHAAVVAELESALTPAGVFLAGAAFHGSGIDAAVRSGVRAGEQLAARLTTTHAAPP